MRDNLNLFNNLLDPDLYHYYRPEFMEELEK